MPTIQTKPDVQTVPKPVTPEELAKSFGARITEQGDTTVATLKLDPPAQTEQPQATTVNASETEASVEDRQAYIRSLLANERFKKQYPLFGGNVNVVFCTRTINENQAAKTAALNAAALDDAETEVLRSKFRMLYSIVSLSIPKLSLERRQLIPDETKPTLDIFGKMDDVLFYAVYEAYKAFEATCISLFRKANDPDFWNKTAGRA